MIRAAFAAAALGALLLAACGPPAPVRCQPSNCSGCCAEDGECIGAVAQSRFTCGAMGADCRACLPDQLCASGRCVRDPDAGVVILPEDAGPPPVDAGQQDSGPVCGQAGQACCNGSQCFLGLACQGGTCQPAGGTDAGACGAVGQTCCANQQCTAAGASCVSNVCVVASSDAGSLRATGEPCTASSQCRDGLCLELGFAGGYCTKGCTVNTDCVAGSHCGNNPTGSPAKVCLAQCASPGMAPGGCRAGYVCEANAGTAGVPVCFPACTSNTMCGVAPTCDSRGFCCGAAGFVCCEGTSCSSGASCVSGTCQAAPNCGNAGQACCTSGPACVGQTVCRSNQCQSCGGANQPCCEGNACTQGACVGGTCDTRTPLGGPCTTTTDCIDGSCISGSPTWWVGGYCTKTCTESNPASCPTGSSCSSLVTSQADLCMGHCTWDGGMGNCRTGYVCDRYLIVGSSQATCYPRCNSSADCGGLSCFQGFCCGARFMRCCAGNTCTSGTCNSLGYCQ